MTPNPLLGVLFHWIGGLASASFYVPYKGVRRWSWEIYWLVGGVFSWIIAPWLFASLQTPDLLSVLGSTPADTLGLCYMFGVLWGFGGLTFGLTMRYLGISLGTAVALGLTAAFGTLIPPLISGQLIDTLVRTSSGQVILLGVAICLVGIAIVGLAGRRKEVEARALPGAVAPETSFRKGILVAVFSGIMSSCFAYGLASGEPIRQLALAHGSHPLWQGLPVLIVVLAGGFTTNAIWCLMLILRNRSGGELLGRARRGETEKPPYLKNLLLSALAGMIWYFQFFFYSMGESQMGRFGFSSWTLHMASIIIFATLWGIALKEWKGASPRVKLTLGVGLAVLIASTAVIGMGNAMAT